MDGVGVEVDTPHGPARLTWHGEPAQHPPGPDRPQGPNRPAALLLLGHGAGGGITAPDLLLTADLAAAAGMAVGLVEQPYRVAGRRAPAPAAQLDVALTAVAAAARQTFDPRPVGTPEIPLLLGGRSSGARVACRTAGALGAVGVLALAFPLLPPRPPGKERPSRLPELVGAAVPVLVVQGERDAFGSADDIRKALAAVDPAGRVDPVNPLTAIPLDVVVSTARGADHSLRRGIDDAAIAKWLTRFLR
jgi:predicted alpha/beta-hydrolase family hydrolase